MRIFRSLDQNKDRARGQTPAPTHFAEKCLPDQGLQRQGVPGFGQYRPMAKDDLTGNMPTENLLAYFDEHNIEHGLNKDAFVEAMSIANTIFK